MFFENLNNEKNQLITLGISLFIYFLISFILVFIALDNYSLKIRLLISLLVMSNILNQICLTNFLKCSK